MFIVSLFSSLSVRRRITIASVFLITSLTAVVADVPDTEKLHMSEWATNGMTQDPVALAFDPQGRLYVVETARRGSVDIDVRAHRDWLLDDLASDDFESMRSFFRSKMATDMSEKNQGWLQDRNRDGTHDYRDLREVSERIRVIEDTDGDGKADRSTLFIEGFNEEFNGVAAGVMPYGDDVLMTVYPDLWRLRDTDGDLKADQKEIMFRGFGVHAAFDGHDLHGLTVGPEGKIYFSCGDNGFSIKTKEGHRLHYPNTGGVLRMNPDGTNLEVFAYGLRNVQEFDFDQYGNMFGVDNDGDLEDERERAVYIAEGSDSGWRLNWQFRSEGWKVHNGGMTYNPWTAEGMWKPQHSEQPAHITPPMQNYSVGPGGFKFNPGTALNEEYRDFFFCVQFPVQKITAFRTQPRGAGFEMVDDHTFNSGLMVSSLNFGPGGGCYLADWIGKWQPNGEGIIYRVDDPTMEQSSIRREVKRFINEGVSTLGNERLFELLGHADRRVRQLAQFELVDRERGRELLLHAKNGSNGQLSRIHALWGILQLRDPGLNLSLAEQLPWSDADPQIRQQCARVAGDLKLKTCEPQLIALLEDEVALVRSHGAIALGKAGSDTSTEALLELLRRNADLDPFVRHAAVFGLAGSASPELLAAAVTDSSSAVRLGAVLALGRKRDLLITHFLSDGEVRVVRETIRAIHDDASIPAALPAVAAMLDNSDLPQDEPILRRIISANYRLGTEEAAQRLLQFVLRKTSLGGLGESMKLEALECLARWDQSPIVDRVEGRIRKEKRDSPLTAKRMLTEHVSAILQSGDPAISAAMLGYVNRLNIDVDAAQFRAWVVSPRVPENARIEALKLIRSSDDRAANGIIDQLVAGKNTKPGSALWRTAFELLVADRPTEAFDRMDWNANHVQRQFYVSQLPNIKSVKADRLLERLVAEQLTDRRDDRLTLDVLNSARVSGKVAELPKLQAAATTEKYGEFSFARTGGDATRGEAIYRNHPNAQCVRCHNAGGAGKQAGPVLNDVGKRDRDYLLRAVVDPNAEIAKGFESVTVIKEDGKMITGTIISENDEVLFLGAPQKTYKIRKAEIEERTEANISAMPEMMNVLSPLEVRDVVEYLSTLVGDSP